MNITLLVVISLLFIPLIILLTHQDHIHLVPAGGAGEGLQ